jgi:Family of unknown function (DUF5335)
MATILWIIAVVLVIAGIVQLFQGQALLGIALIVIGFLVGPGGVSIFATTTSLGMVGLWPTHPVEVRHPGHPIRTPTTRSRDVCGRSTCSRSADMSDQGPELPRAQWQARLEELTKHHEGHEVAIELLDQELGDEEGVEMLPLAYLEFDPKDDVVIVAVGGRGGRYPVVLRHIVEHPQRILADSYGDERSALDIVDRYGDHTIVTIQPRTAS